MWAVATALAAATGTLALNRRRLPALRLSMDAGANASVLPVFSVASLVGFGAVVAALPAFAAVREWVLSIGGGRSVSLAAATNVLAALTGSASGGLTIALDALGATYLRLAAETGIDPGLMHRVAVIGAGTLDSLPHNGAVVTLLAVCGSTHRESYLDLFIAGRGRPPGAGGGDRARDGVGPRSAGLVDPERPDQHEARDGGGRAAGQGDHRQVRSGGGARVAHGLLQRRPCSLVSEAPAAPGQKPAFSRSTAPCRR